MADLVLRDGETVTQDRRLDLIPRVDPRSLADYPIRPLLAAPAPARGRSWAAGPVLDQGREGACVGFAVVGELAAQPGPRIQGIDLDALARSVYRRAQELDPWPETGPGGTAEGTDLTSGGKAMVELGFADEYRWVRDIDELARTITTTTGEARARGAVFGPVVAAVEWRHGMYEATTPTFGPLPPRVDITGPLVGYHAILIRGVMVRTGRYGFANRAFRWRNSWGPTYGQGGDALIAEEDLATILGLGDGLPASLMVPVHRLRPKRSS